MQLSIKVIAWPKCKNEKRNPYQALLYRAVERYKLTQVVEFSPLAIFSPSRNLVLHIHWPDVFLDSATGVRFWLKLLFLRGVFLFGKLRKMPIIWTAHNLKRTGQRNASKLDAYFWPWFSNNVDGVIYMTQASKEVAENTFKHWKTIPNVTIPHGHYQPIFENSLNLNDVDFDNDVTCPDILFFGSITKYKNVYKLLNAFLELPPGTAHLSIKGELSDNSPDKKLVETLANLPEDRTSEVTFFNNFLGDSELVKAINDTILVVFPYADVLNSGAAIFALSVGRPILASNTPLFRELQQMVGEDWVYLIDGELDAHDLSDAMSKAKMLKQNGSNPDLSKFEWDVIAQQTVDFYHQVLSKECKKP